MKRTYHPDFGMLSHAIHRQQTYGIWTIFESNWCFITVYVNAVGVVEDGVRYVCAKSFDDGTVHVQNDRLQRGDPADAESFSLSESTPPRVFLIGSFQGPLFDLRKKKQFELHRKQGIPQQTFWQKSCVCHYCFSRSSLSDPGGISVTRAWP